MSQVLFSIMLYCCRRAATKGRCICGRISWIPADNCTLCTQVWRCRVAVFLLCCRKSHRPFSGWYDTQMVLLFLLNLPIKCYQRQNRYTVVLKSSSELVHLWHWIAYNVLMCREETTHSLNLYTASRCIWSEIIWSRTGAAIGLADGTLLQVK